MKSRTIMLLIVVVYIILLIVLIRFGITLGAIPLTLLGGFALKTARAIETEEAQRIAAEHGAPPANTWTCSCGKLNSNFVSTCPCGKSKPVSAAAITWNCSCGKSNPSYTSTCSCGKNKRDVLLENSNAENA